MGLHRTGAPLLRMQLASFLLPDLLESLQEELLNVTALVQYHLTKRFKVLDFLRLHPNALPRVPDLLALLLDDLLVLVLHQLLLLLKVLHYL